MGVYTLCLSVFRMYPFGWGVGHVVFRGVVLCLRVLGQNYSIRCDIIEVITPFCICFCANTVAYCTVLFVYTCAGSCRTSCASYFE